jgi:hypothetical protein
MWLVAHNRCWTTDCLARRGIPHPEHCPLCDQAPKTINHLHVGCTFARDFRFRFHSHVGLQTLSPQLTDTSFYDWWKRVNSDRSGLLLHGLNSLIILGAWTIWTQRNRCVFDGVVPAMTRVLTLSSEERKLWSMAGARGISFSLLPLPLCIRSLKVALVGFSRARLVSNSSLGWNVCGVRVCVGGSIE